MTRKRPSRDQTLKVRLTDDDLVKLKRRAAAADLSVSEFVRLAALDEKPDLPRRRRFVFHPVDPALTRQLAAIGNNLNQIASWLNRWKSRADAASILPPLIEIERQVEAIRSQNTHREPPP